MSNPKITIVTATYNLIANGREETFKQSTSAIPLGRPQTVEDIANMVLYLASDTAKNITAQNIAVDGGYTFDL